MVETVSSGYTLPVWVAAAARAALQKLLEIAVNDEQPLLVPQEALVPIKAVAPLGQGRAMAIVSCEGGAALDLTRGLMIWVEACWLQPAASAEWLQLEPGEGLGVYGESGDLCISGYARQLLEINLKPLMPSGCCLGLRITIPKGRALAERTSNAAFGVVQGLALIGNQAQVQKSAGPDALQQALAELHRRVEIIGGCDDLVLVLGENGLNLAPQLGIPAEKLLKVGNWLGPLLAAAAEVGVQRLLLFGYHGKLLKLAGGIFHTHHHLADGRAEVLTALAALEGLQGEGLRQLWEAATVDQALAQLEARDPQLAERLRHRIVCQIETRCAAYLKETAGSNLKPGAALFNRARKLWAVGPMAQPWFLTSAH
jgi:cobalt-precorrin-5B (C1)-methyltransferase